MSEQWRGAKNAAFLVAALVSGCLGFAYGIGMIGGALHAQVAGQNSTYPLLTGDWHWKAPAANFAALPATCNPGDAIQETDNGSFWTCSPLGGSWRNGQTDGAGGSWRGYVGHETITLSTSSVTSPGTTGMLQVPSGSAAVIDGVACRVTVAVTGATGLQVGDGTTVDRFCSSGALALTAGSTAVCLNFLQPVYATTNAKGSVQASTAQVVITATGGTATAGAVECSSFEHSITPPAN